MKRKYKDITGQRFGKLTVLQYNHVNKEGSAYWRVKCDCGNEKIVHGGTLRNGHCKSCGCLWHEKSLKEPDKNFYNLVGKKINYLTILEATVKERPDFRGDRFYWKCRCECGKIKELYWRDVVYKNIKSCGCRGVKRVSLIPEIHKLYGMYKRGAEKRNYEFELEPEYFEELLKGNCHYCDSPPAAKMKLWNNSKSWYWYNGIDRVKNNVGYLKSNSISCCKVCNRMKMAMGQEEFLDKIENIYNNLINSQYKDESQIDTSDFISDITCIEPEQLNKDMEKTM